MAISKKQLGLQRQRLSLANRLSGLDHRRLSYLKEAVAVGSVRGAAERLGTSASALSRQIMRMETELQIPLLERHGRGVRATEAGALMVEYFAEQQSRLDAVVSQIQDMAEMRRGVVSLALGEGFLWDAMGAPLKGFADRYPQLQIDLQLGSTDSLLRLILEDKAHIAILYNLPNEPRVQSHASCRHTMRIVTNSTHPLAQLGRKIAPTDLRSYDIGLHPGGYGVRQVLLAAEHHGKLRLSPRLTTNSLWPLVRFAEEWNGVLLTPNFTVEREIAEGRLVALPAQDDFLGSAEAHLITRRGRRLPVAAAHLLRQLAAGLKVFKAPHSSRTSA